jgi:hypothetical protein
VKLAPEFNAPESNVDAPVGALLDVTVCGLVSWLTQVTVLLTPITNVIFADE